VVALEPSEAVGVAAFPAAAVAVLLLAVLLAALPGVTAIAGLTGRLDPLPEGVPGWLAIALVSLKLLRFGPPLLAVALVRREEDAP
jgi:hypothetical protein